MTVQNTQQKVDTAKYDEEHDRIFGKPTPGNKTGVYKIKDGQVVKQDTTRTPRIVK